MVLDSKRLTGPEILTVSVLIIVGGFFVLAIPIGGGWDEETHVIRAWEIASLRFIPNELPRNELPFPAIYWNLSYRRPALIRPVSPAFWSEYGQLPIDADDYIYGTLETRSVYSPPLLGPQALAIRYLGHKLQLPALPVYYASRLAGLLSYTLLTWLAVRIAPFGKWLLALVAITPTAVFQAATISADPLSNALALLFVAGTMAFALRPTLAGRDLAGLTILISLLFLAKPNAAFLALLSFVVIRPSQFQVRHGYMILVIATVLLGLVEVGGWTLVAFPRAGVGTGEGDPLAQLLHVAAHPFGFIWTMLMDLAGHGLSYLRQWIAEFGYEYWSVPLPTYFLYGLALGAAIFSSADGPAPSRRIRAGLALGFGVVVLGTSLSLYLAVTPAGGREILGVQGRYFAPAIPLLLLAFLRSPSPAVRAIPIRWSVILGVSALIVYGAGLGLAYHVPCGTAFFEPGLCYQPVYKNWAPDARYSAAISNSFTLTQEIVPECNGLAEVRIWVNGAEAAAGGETRINFDDPGSGQILASESVQNSTLPHGGWQELRFKPDWKSAGKLYELSIEGGLGSGAAGPKIAYSLRPEYEAGRLFEGELPVDYDLVFQYGCVAGWEKLVFNSGSTPATERLNGS